MRRSGGIGIFGILYLIVGVIVAANRGYLVEWNVPGNLVEGVLAVLLWPVLFFGVDLHGLIP